MLAQKVYIFLFYLEGENAMGRSVGPALKAAALLLIFPLFHHERWVCLEIHCWKGELNGGWTEGGVCLGGISISYCVALLSSSKHFLFKRVRKYRLRRSTENNIWSEL